MLRKLKNMVRDSSLNTYIPGLYYYNYFIPARAIRIRELACIFMPVTKCANRSMKTAFADHLKLDYELVHKADWDFVSQHEMARSDYFRFAFVRHPLDRLLSCYTQKVAYYGQNPDLPFVFWMFGKRFARDMTFTDFVHAVAKIPDAVSDPHFRSQHCFVYYKGKPLYDYLGRFENLEADWQTVCERLGCDLSLPHENKSSHEAWQDVYSPELRVIAEKRYARDLELFDYK